MADHPITGGINAFHNNITIAAAAPIITIKKNACHTFLPFFIFSYFLWVYNYFVINSMAPEQQTDKHFLHPAQSFRYLTVA
jgi:hypothetical protein